MYHWIDGTVVSKAAKDLSKCKANITPVPQTMGIHHVATVNYGEIFARKLSCFCSATKDCNCFGMEKHIFPVSRHKVNTWVSIVYEGEIYPGIIISVEATSAKVKCAWPVSAKRKEFFPVGR